MADQCVASASNFAVGIIVARLSGPAGLGAFAFAYSCWILLTTIHRSLITDPMAISGHMRQPERQEFVRRGFAGEVALGAAAAGVFIAVGIALFAIGQPTFGTGMLAIAPWVIALDLQDYWRWIGFMQGTPKKSLLNDLLFNGVQAAAFGVVFLTHQHSVFAVVSAWGLGAAAASVYGLYQFSARPSLRGGVSFLRSHWPTSSWLVSERATSWGASQLYLILAGAFLGAAALGGLKASQGLVMGPVFVVINAGGSFGLPEATRQLAERGWAGMAKVTRFVTGAGVLAAVACAIAVLAAAPLLLKLLYGPEFVALRTQRTSLRRVHGGGSIWRGTDTHLDRHAPDSSPLLGAARTAGLLCCGRLCALSLLRGYRRSGLESADRCGDTCRGTNSASLCPQIG